MKNTKWINIRVGENAFTVRCERYDQCGFGVVVSFDIYELHEHPTNFLKRFLEFWRYKQFTSDKWIECFSRTSLQEYIIHTCELIVNVNKKHLDAIKQWENL